MGGVGSLLGVPVGFTVGFLVGNAVGLGVVGPSAGNNVGRGVGRRVCPCGGVGVGGRGAGPSGSQTSSYAQGALGPRLSSQHSGKVANAPPPPSAARLVHRVPSNHQRRSSSHCVGAGVVGAGEGSRWGCDGFLVGISVVTLFGFWVGNLMGDGVERFCTGFIVGCLVGCLVGWLVGRRVGWLVGVGGGVVASGSTPAGLHAGRREGRARDSVGLRGRRRQ